MLTQVTPDAENVWSIVTWSAVFLVLLVVGFMVVAAVRRYYRDDDADGAVGGGPGFTLHQLRQMRRDGEINDEQYEKLRAQIAGSLGLGADDKSQPAEKAEPDDRDGEDGGGPSEGDGEDTTGGDRR